MFLPDYLELKNLLIKFFFFVNKKQSQNTETLILKNQISSNVFIFQSIY